MGTAFQRIPLSALEGGEGLQRVAGETRRAPRTRVLLEAPIVRTLLRLAAPNILVMLAQASTGLVETYFVGKLGTDALAGVALVFPGVMLMQMMSAGAMGGGISSAIARALGGGRRDDADALVLHALVISAVLGLLFTARRRSRALSRSRRERPFARCGARLLQRRLCRRHLAVGLQHACQCIARHRQHDRAGGRHLRRVGVPGAPLSLPDIRLGPVPAARCRRRRDGDSRLLRDRHRRARGLSVVWPQCVRPRLRGVRLRWRLFREILRVGAVAALVTVQNNLTVLATTGLIGTFGPAAIAGYGVGSRLEYLLVPLVFGLGAPLVALVGTNIGAGSRDRALRVAWTGAAIGFVISEAIGLWAAVFPGAWLSLFCDDQQMISAGSAYLRAVGPFYGFFGLGLALYFSSQGAGRLLWPLCAGFLRLAIAVAGAWLILRWTGELSYMFIALGVGLAAYGLINAAAVKSGAWFIGPKRMRVSGGTSRRWRPAT
jgi:Na+-driven multidrug efflux pump